MKKILLYIIPALMITACGNNNKDKKNSTDTGLDVQTENVAEAPAEEWITLFNGKDTEGWRGYNEETFPSEGWIVEEGTLKSLGRGGDIGGDIVYGAESFGDFELYLEWKISEGGNSGVFYHIVEGDKYNAPYYTAPEYQVIDQIGFPEKLESWQSIGADYGMYDPDYEGVVKKAGEWNTTRILFTAEKAEYYLNGKKTVEFVPWSDDWKTRKSEGKWKDYPDYGEAKTGLIGLQDHGSFIWYRNIKVRKL